MTSKANLALNEISNQKKDFIRILNMIRKREFKGNSGLAVKNSMFQFSTTFLAKLGSFVFTFIFARILLPEAYGLYALILSTAIFFSVFADWGIGQALVRFVSRSFEKKNYEDLKSYYSYLVKIRFFALIATSVLLLILSRIIALNYYHKPITLGLVGASLYVFMIGMITFYEYLFQATNNFKKSFFREIIIQTSRLILVPLVAIYAIRISNQEVSLGVIMVGISLCYTLSLLYMIYSAHKEFPFLSGKAKELDAKKKKEVNRFIFAMSSTVLSGLFIGYIDMIILGRYINPEFIGYYQAALTLISGFLPLIPIASVVLPIFSKLDGRRLKKAFGKTLRATLLAGLAMFIILLLIAPYAVRIIYGSAFNPSTNLLRMFGLLMILMPLNSIYDVYFISRGRPGIITKILISTTIVNLILNFVLILTLLNYSQWAASFGAAVAVVASRGLYLLMSIVLKKTNKI